MLLVLEDMAMQTYSSPQEGASWSGMYRCGQEAALGANLLPISAR